MVRHDLDRKISRESWGEKPKRISIILEVGIVMRRGKSFLPGRKLFYAAIENESVLDCVFVVFFKKDFGIFR